LNKYIDPLAKLLCVTIDNSPDMATFYAQTTANSLDTKLNEIKLNSTSKRHNQGFSATAFQPDVQTQGEKVYKIGDKIKSMIISENLILKDQYSYAFPLPKPDSFGICNNYNSAHFMMDDKSQCLQMANLETECTTLLNAQYYSENMKYYLGQGAKEGDNKAV
jgi:hypothetical protein